MARALRQVNEANAAMTLELSRLRDRTSASGAAGDAVPRFARMPSHFISLLTPFWNRLNTNGNALLEELKQQNQTYLEEVFALNKANKQLVEERRRAQEDLRRREEKYFENRTPTRNVCIYLTLVIYSDIKLHDHIFSLEKQLRELQELTRNKDMATQVLHDELQALQLEVSNRDDRLRELEQSNRRLAEQWMKKLNDDTALAGSTYAFMFWMVLQADAMLPQASIGRFGSGNRTAYFSGAANVRARCYSFPSLSKPISKTLRLVVGKPQIATVLLPKNIHKQFVSLILLVLDLVC